MAPDKRAAALRTRPARDAVHAGARNAPELAPRRGWFNIGDTGALNALKSRLGANPETGTPPATDGSGVAS